MEAGTRPKLTASAAVLLVMDVVKAANHYRDAMEFAYERFYGEPPGFVILYRDEMYLMLKQVEHATAIVPRSRVEGGLCDVYFWTSDVKALHAELVGRGAKIFDELCQQEYGCLEFAAEDLDGYLIRFGEVVGEQRAQAVYS
jgi:hypothetical protein